MSARRVCRCGRCSLAASHLPAGFLSRESLRCTRTDEDVDPEDGCTFGAPGRPAPGAVAYDVFLDHSPEPW